MLGAGVSEGAWPPVIAAIEEIRTKIEPKGVPFDGDIESANLWLARWVYYRRQEWEFSKSDRAEARRGHPITDTEFDEFHTHPYARWRTHEKVDLALKQAIARHLREAVYTNRLRVRDRFLKGLAHPRLDQLLLVTTNWDPEAREALPQFQRLEPAPSPR